MVSIPIFSAPAPSAPALQPQSAGDVGVLGITPASATQQYFDPKKLANLLQGSQTPSGTPSDSLQNAPMALGNGQNTMQQTAQGYPVGGTAQIQNQQNFMGGMGGSGNSSYNWMGK